MATCPTTSGTSESDRKVREVARSNFVQPARASSDPFLNQLAWVCLKHSLKASAGELAWIVEISCALWSYIGMFRYRNHTVLPAKLGAIRGLG